MTVDKHYLPKGARVRLSNLGNLGSNKHDRDGTVIATPRSENTRSVIWDGRKVRQRFHVDFLEPAPILPKSMSEAIDEMRGLLASASLGDEAAVIELDRRFYTFSTEYPLLTAKEHKKFDNLLERLDDLGARISALEEASK